MADKEGFKFPHVSNECINCGLCLKVCPVIYKKLTATAEVYAAKSLNIKNLYRASSGGVFLECAKFGIENNFQVYGASYSTDFESVTHVCVYSQENLSNLIGSKYVQSDLGLQFKKVKEQLNRGEEVVFSGTPCQIMGLKNYIGKDYDNLILIDLLCHGVPSPGIFRQYIQAIKEKFGAIKGINMKDKEDGWGHQKPKIILKNGKTVPKHYSSLWNKIFYSRFCLRPSCYTCPFTSTNRPGDLSIGDFWGIEKFHPDFYDNNGVSLVMINSEKGSHFFKCVKSRFSLLESSIEVCLQQALEHPIEAPTERNFFWKIFYNQGFYRTVEIIWGIRFEPKFISLCKRVIRKLKI